MKKIILILSILLSACTALPTLSTQQLQATQLPATASPLAESPTPTIDAPATSTAQQLQIDAMQGDVISKQAEVDTLTRKLYDQEALKQSGISTIAAYTQGAYLVAETHIAETATMRLAENARIDELNRVLLQKIENDRMYATQTIEAPTQAIAAQRAKEFVDNAPTRAVTETVWSLSTSFFVFVLSVFLVVAIVYLGKRLLIIWDYEKAQAEEAAQLTNLAIDEAQTVESDTPISEIVPQSRPAVTVPPVGKIVPCSQGTFTAFCENVIKQKSPIARDSMVVVLGVFKDNENFEAFRVFAQLNLWILSAGRGMYKPSELGYVVFSDWLENKVLPDGYGFESEEK